MKNTRLKTSIELVARRIKKNPKLCHSAQIATISLYITGICEHEGVANAIITMIAAGKIPGVVFAPDGVIAFPDLVQL